MPRAHRHYLPGHIWHLTHRCHDRQFLLEHSEDRQGWLGWLRKAQKKYGLPVLGYSVTCNHVHLLVQDTGRPNLIARSMQLIQGQFAQHYNERNDRQNAFWGDRYHATAVEKGIHLARCLAYVDLNMVRAGAVSSPGEWDECGYREIQGDPPGASIVDRQLLAAALGVPDLSSLRRVHSQAIEDAKERCEDGRDPRWSESLAVGSMGFVADFSGRLDRIRNGPAIHESSHEDEFALREPPAPEYGAASCFLAGENTVEWAARPEASR